METDDRPIAPGMAIETEYLNVTIDENGLLIIRPTAELQEEAERFLAMNRIEAWHEATFELAEHGLSHVEPEEIGALTANHTLLAEDVERDDRGNLIKCGRVHYYDNYQVLCPVYEIIGSLSEPGSIRLNHVG